MPASICHRGEFFLRQRHLGILGTGGILGGRATMRVDGGCYGCKRGRCLVLKKVGLNQVDKSRLSTEN